MWSTEDLVRDAPALGRIAEQAFGEEFGFAVDDEIIRGTGAGRCLGILDAAAGATIEVAAETGQAADTVLAENVLSMWARLWTRSKRRARWLINADMEPQLYGMTLTVGTGGTAVPIYGPPTDAAPFGTLMGRPIEPIEQAATLGDRGDIILADLNEYVVFEQDISLARSIHVQFLTDEEAFRFSYPVDGQPIWSKPITPAQGTATQSPFVTLAARA
jgi:HK97 family phage major capsid protein